MRTILAEIGLPVAPNITAELERFREAVLKMLIGIMSGQFYVCHGEARQMASAWSCG
jgi:hypothetical protein